MSVARFSAVVSRPARDLSFLTALKLAQDAYICFYGSKECETARLVITDTVDHAIERLQQRMEREDFEEQRVFENRIEELRAARKHADNEMFKATLHRLETLRLQIGQIQAKLPAEWLSAIVQRLETGKKDKTPANDILKLRSPGSELGKTFTLERYVHTHDCIPQDYVPTSLVERLYIRELTVQNAVKWVINKMENPDVKVGSGLEVRR